MRIDVIQAKAELSKLLVRVEAGEEVEITCDGIPVARLVRAAPTPGRVPGPGATFLAARGSLSGQIIEDEFEFTERDLDELLDDSG